MHSQTYQVSPTKGQEQQKFHRGLVEDDCRYRRLWDYGALDWSSKEELGFSTKLPALKCRELFHDEYHTHSYPFIPLLTYNSLSYIPRVDLLRIHFPLPDYDGKRTLRYQVPMLPHALELSLQPKFLRTLLVIFLWHSTVKCWPLVDIQV